MTANAFSNDPAIIKEYVAEFNDVVQPLELNILALEKDYANRELLNDIFRPVHSLKGASSFLGFGYVAAFCHKFENLLDDLRKGRKKAGKETIDLLLAGVDVLKKLIDDVARGGSGESVEVQAVVALLDTGGVEAPAARPPATPPPEPPAAGNAKADVEIFLTAAGQHLCVIARSLQLLEKGSETPQTIDNFFRAVHSLKASAAFMRFNQVLRLVEAQEQLLERLRRGDEEISPEILAACGDFSVKLQEVCEAIRATGKDDVDVEAVIRKISAVQQRVVASVPRIEDAKARAGSGAADYTAHTIRVGTDKLDSIMNLIGELMIDQSRFDDIERKIAAGEEPGVVARAIRDVKSSMGRITDELHAAVMGARMVPVGTLFHRFPRVVRELAKRGNKEVELVISGEETEIDKTIIEEINDPLLHLIRNAFDHGLETAEARAAAGKRQQGTIALRAYHESGNVVIEVEDDGRGIDREKVRARAVKNGVVSKEQAEKMGEQELLDLIFLPGFSTAEEVTDISGRGVGMDVVKTNIERVRGKIHIETEPGRGTKMLLKLPLTMAIIEALMVRAAGETFALPILAVDSIVRQRTAELHTVGGEGVSTIHNKSISVVRLGKLLNLPGAEGSGDRVYIVVLKVKNARGNVTEIGFIVDTVYDRQKIIIKPLDESVASGEGFLGVTILGDGQTALIVDPVEITALAERRAERGEEHVNVENTRR